MHQYLKCLFNWFLGMEIVEFDWNIFNMNYTCTEICIVIDIGKLLIVIMWKTCYDQCSYITTSFTGNYR